MSTQDAPRRTQAQRRSESEESLLDAAAESIAERGIERTSLALVGEKAGKSRGLANHHFGSKNALVERLSARCQDRLEAATVEAFERVRKRDPEAASLDYILVMVDVYLQHFERPTAEEQALIVMWGATFPSDASVEGMLEADRRAYDGVATLIRNGQQDGSISPTVDPRATAVVILGVMRGVAAQQLTEAAVINIPKVRASCREWITAALTS